MSGERLETWAPRVARALGGVPDAIARARSAVLASGLADARRRSGHPHLAAAIRGLQDRGRLSISSEHPAAEARELGKRVRGTPYLTVPLRADVRQSGGPLRDGRLFVVRLRDGRLFLARRQGRTIDIRWRLVDSVLVTHRPAIVPAGAAMTAALAPRLEGELRRTLGAS